MKLVFKSLCVTLIVVFLILLTEAVIYYKVLNKEDPISPADAVVIFSGGSARIKEGYRLVNEGLAPFLVVSSADIDTRKKYDNTYGCTGTWTHLTEERADSTFQNALLTSRLIRKHQLRKVVLVTDSWHMPRSYLLFRIILTGTNVEIFPQTTHAGFYTGPPMKWSHIEKRLIYKELVKFWGSVYEMGLYFVSGKLPEKSLKEKPWVKTLWKVVLLGA